MLLLTHRYHSDIGEYLIPMIPEGDFDFTKVAYFIISFVRDSDDVVVPNSSVSYFVKLSNLRVIYRENYSHLIHSQSSWDNNESSGPNDESSQSLSQSSITSLQSSNASSNQSTLTYPFFTIFLFVVILFFIN